MAGSTARTVYDIFQTMEYGPTSSISSTAQAWLDSHSLCLDLFIDGKWNRPAGRQSCHIANSTGGSVCSIVCGEEEDMSLSISSAVSGFKAWSTLTGHQRARIFLRLASEIQKHTQCLAELCELVQYPSSTQTLVRLVQYYADWAQLRDMLLPDWSPLGVVAVVVSDDCSLFSLWMKVLPALAMGNAVVVFPGVGKAAPVLLLAQLFTEAGLLAGVLNILTDKNMSLGIKVAQHPSISYVTYSGNKKDGEMLCRATAGCGIHVTLSLSVLAVCPFIIFESADINSAVDGVIDTAFKKKKECQWVLFVQESIWDNVVAQLKLRMAGMKCIPLAAGTDRVLVDSAVQQSQQQGATLIQTSHPPQSGSLYPPTVLCGVAPSCSCVVVPPPGPILPLVSFRSAKEAITLGNHSPHGQAASIWTEDLTLALESAKGLSVGLVCINAHSFVDPSLPVSDCKESGNSTNGGREGLFQFLHPSCSPCPPRSSKCSVDYKNFGTATRFVTPIPEQLSSAPRSYLQFVGGKQCKADSGCNFPILAPGGGVFALCPDGGKKDIRNAVESAIKVLPGWMKKSSIIRAQFIHSLAKNVALKRQNMAIALHSQTGISLEEAEKEVDLSSSHLFDWAARCDKERGEVLAVPHSGSSFSIPEPLGVVGVVLPDSRPLLSLVSLLGAAVATGNAIIMIPSEKYPIAALEFIQVLLASELPAGIVSIITGGKDQLTRALANHSAIQAIWYWGSQEGCQFLQHTCCSPLKKLWLHWGNEGEGDWAHTHPSLLQETWRQAVQWKSVWIPTS